MLAAVDFTVEGGDRLCHKVMEQGQQDRARELAEAQGGPVAGDKDEWEVLGPEQDRAENASARLVEQPSHINGELHVRVIRARIAEQP